ncbi:hypothetical protein [Bacillus sp. JJ1764]|uniref:hypothetical protein n=1 Tax=Bacillus sp. JJ1764 TaxID=3122964 RepID=UPI002FFE024C
MEVITNDKNYYTIPSNVIGKVLSLTESTFDGSKLHMSNIPEKKLSNVMSIYGIDKSRILALYDTTVFNSGKDGIVLSDYFIGLKHAFGSPNVVAFEELVLAAISEEEKVLEINDLKIDIRSSDFTKFFKSLKETLISEDSYLRDKYEDYVEAQLKDTGQKINNDLYDEAVEQFLILENTVTNNNEKFCATLYHFGCSIRMEQLNFDDAYNYFVRLEQLQQWEENEISELKQTIDTRKAQHEYNLLEEQKNDLIAQNQYDIAMEIANEQKKLEVKSAEQLDQEIERVEVLKQEYIASLEAQVVEQLDRELYREVLRILEELNKVNPNGNYDEYDVRVKTGLYEFEKAEQKINSIKEMDLALAGKLEQKLDKTKKGVSEIIQNAVSCKDYSLFRENPNLKYVKDNWGMTPLMHFIIQKDLDGVELLADTFDVNGRNAIGHTSLNLVAIDYEDHFWREAFMLLDQHTIALMEKFKSKTKKNKIGKLALKGLDSLNGRTLMSFEIAEATSSAESKMEREVEELQHEIEAHLENLLRKNYNDFLKYSRNPKDYSGDYNERLTEKLKLENDLEKAREKQTMLQNSLGERLEEAKNAKLDKILLEAAEIELGEKDEFETSSEYENRKNSKADELKLSYMDNAHVKEQLAILEEKVKNEVNISLEETEEVIESNIHKLSELEKEMNELYYLLNCQSESDINEILNYYYRPYISRVEIGKYDADKESFEMIVNGKEGLVKVPRNIAKEFKMRFSELKPFYKMESIKVEGKENIQHIFVYDFNGEQVKVPFMLSINEMVD